MNNMLSLVTNGQSTSTSLKQRFINSYFFHISNILQAYILTYDRNAVSDCFLSKSFLSDPPHFPSLSRMEINYGLLFQQ